MKLTRSSNDTIKGPADWFTGDVYIDMIPAGAAPTRFMVHTAMQEADDSGNPVTWGEHVTDEQYNAAPPT